MTDFKVTDEAVEAAGAAFHGVKELMWDEESMRAALEAALPVMFTKVGYATVQRWRGIDSAINYDFDYIGDLPDGTYCVFAIKEPK